jgi:hypothetical protein
VSAGGSGRGPGEAGEGDGEPGSGPQAEDAEAAPDDAGASGGRFERVVEPVGEVLDGEDDGDVAQPAGQVAVRDEDPEMK